MIIISTSSCLKVFRTSRSGEATGRPKTSAQSASDIRGRSGRLARPCTGGFLVVGVAKVAFAALPDYPGDISSLSQKDHQDQSICLRNTLSPVEKIVQSTVATVSAITAAVNSCAPRPLAGSQPVMLAMRCSR